MARVRSRSSPPMACGDVFDMGCVVADTKGFKFKCSVHKAGETRGCAKADFDIRDGKLRFHDV